MPVHVRRRRAVHHQLGGKGVFGTGSRVWVVVSPLATTLGGRFSRLHTDLIQCWLKTDSRPRLPARLAVGGPALEAHALDCPRTSAGHRFADGSACKGHGAVGLARACLFSSAVARGEGPPRTQERIEGGVRICRSGRR
jgi:hypothetical protein